MPEPGEALERPSMGSPVREDGLLPNGAFRLSGYGAQWGYYTDRETGLVLCTHRDRSARPFGGWNQRGAGTRQPVSAPYLLGIRGCSWGSANSQFHPNRALAPGGASVFCMRTRSG
jgi:hypothetical protein